MSDKSNKIGRAYEYVFLQVLEEEISSLRPSVIEKNPSFEAAEQAWESIDISTREHLEKGARAALPTLFKMEPMILEEAEFDNVTLRLQPDQEGEKGDVRDLVISREGIDWEVGISLKHNHFAVKHSRISKTIDFGEKWYGMPCSQDYWDDVVPVFDHLEELKTKNVKWRDVPNKENEVYVPILHAIAAEINRAYAQNSDMAAKLVSYLIGRFDSYKVIARDREEQTQIQAFNLHKTLNRPGKEKPTIEVPFIRLPERIIHCGMKPSSETTIELFLDNGWQFSFRIHSASSLVENSLKLDIQIAGVPIGFITLDCIWS